MPPRKSKNKRFRIHETKKSIIIERATVVKYKGVSMYDKDRRNIRLFSKGKHGADKARKLAKEALDKLTK